MKTATLGLSFILSFLSVGVAHAQFENRIPIRDPLGADRTYYVRTDGNDSNSGFLDTSTGAFRTIQRAVDVVSDALDIGGHDITIQVADGTYENAVVIGPIASTGLLKICGNPASPSSVIISTTSASCFRFVGCLPKVPFMVADLTMQTTESGHCISATNSSLVTVDHVVFGPCAQAHINSETSANIIIAASYTIAGSAQNHFRALQQGTITRGAINPAISLSGTPNFIIAFAQASQLSLISLWGATYSGSATGMRYYADTNSVLYTIGGVNYFPGSIAGSTATGGQYL